MSKISLRPTCYYNSKKSKDEIFNLIKKKLEEEHTSIEGVIVEDYAFIRIAKSLQHYWSPELQITVRAYEKDFRIRALYGPKPVVWTMFMFFYGLVLAISFFGAIYGIIQWWLDMPATFLWFIPAGIIGLALVYGAAKFGQYKGNEQKEMLKSFAMKIIQDQD